MTTRDLPSEVARLRAWQLEHPRADPEEHYPAFYDLRSAALSACLEPAVASTTLALILEVLGLDHEPEFLLDALSGRPQAALSIAVAGLDHPDPNTRWQVAVLLGRIATPTAIGALRRLLTDGHEYVRRRALLSIRDLDRTAAEETAVGWLNSQHEYSRMVALDTLALLHSANLDEALARLADDPSDVVQARRLKIASER